MEKTESPGVGRRGDSKETFKRKSDFLEFRMMLVKAVFWALLVLLHFWHLANSLNKVVLPKA